jgi:ABC-2 type transport system ATP-binding protein
MTMTDSGDAFVHAKKVFFDYTQQVNPLAQLIGKQPIRQSVLREVTFSLSHGAHVVVFGSEAAGKTTLLRLLAGFLKPTAGHLAVNGKPPHTVPHAAVGYVAPQASSHATSKTPHQILQTHANQHTVPTAAARLQEITEILKLESCMYRPVATLATSERARFHIARAALSASPVILLDDITEVLEIKEVK